MRIGVAEKAVALTVKDENGNEIKVDSVNKFKYSDHLVGKNTDDLNSYFTNNEAFHHILELADSREFLFFNGSKEAAIKNDNIAKAKEAVIDILNKSNSICYLCDPYFNEKDFIEFASQVSSLDVKIRIINSKADVDVNRLLILRDLIDKYNQTLGINDYIQCRVLRGNESRLHDRFIASDNGVWYLGSSFSEFGARACSLAKLSESAALSVLQNITDWWNSDEITMPINDIVREKPKINIRQTIVKLLRKLANYLEK